MNDRWRLTAHGATLGASAGVAMGLPTGVRLVAAVIAGAGVAILAGMCIDYARRP